MGASAASVCNDLSSRSERWKVRDAGLMAGETIEFGGQVRVVEDVEVRRGGSGQFRFHLAETAEIPGGGNELVEQNLLESALRPDVSLELGV